MKNYPVLGKSPTVCACATHTRIYSTCASRNGVGVTTANASVVRYSKNPSSNVGDVLHTTRIDRLYAAANAAANFVRAHTNWGKPHKSSALPPQPARSVPSFPNAPSREPQFFPRFAGTGGARHETQICNWQVPNVFTKALCKH